MQSAPHSLPGPDGTGHLSAPIGVRVAGVGRRFDNGVEALASISLDVVPGRLVAFIGPSGCGKTTLLRIVGGLDRATSGQVLFDGGERPAGAVGYGFQDARLLPWRSVLGNVALPFELAGVPRAERQARAADMLARVGLADFADARPHTLSGGMQMRVALARALVIRPRLLLLDEPFGALDEITRGDLDDELRRLWRASPMTVLLVTHSISEAIYLADRVIVLAPRPRRIVDDFEVSIPHDERRPGLRTTPRFVEYVARASTALERGVRDAAAAR